MRGTLSTPKAAALYVGALLGPGLLLLPALADRIAGPASVLAWLGLLALSALFAIVFTRLGVGFGSRSGVAGYVRAGLGPRAGRVAGVVLRERRGARRTRGLPHRRGLRHRAVRRWSGAHCRDRRGDPAGRARADLRRRARLRGGAGRAGRRTRRPGRHGGRRIGGELARPAVDAVRAARLARGRQRGRRADAVLRRLGGDRADDGPAARPGERNCRASSPPPSLSPRSAISPSPGRRSRRSDRRRGAARRWPG